MTVDPLAMEAVFLVDGERIENRAYAGGPWDPSMQQGSAPAVLTAWAIETVPAAQPMDVARMTLELLRPVPVGPLTLSGKVLREAVVQMLKIGTRKCSGG
jgi:hypothetical protein